MPDDAIDPTPDGHQPTPPTAAPGPDPPVEPHEHAALDGTIQGEPVDDANRGAKRSGEEVLLDLDLPAAEWFCDEHGAAHGHVLCDVPSLHREVIPVGSGEMDRYIVARSLENRGNCPSRAERATYREAMQALAWRGGRHSLENRFVRREGEDAVWIDMADPVWRAIKVTKEGWSVVDEPPPLFRRRKHQLPLAMPLRAERSDPREIFDFLPAMSGHDKLLCMAWLTTVPLASIARPIVLLIGPQGAAKSSASRRLRTIFDPSRVPLLGDDGRRDLVLTMHNHAIPAFDNLSRISGPESDLLCRAVTGGGSERRKLFTDTDEVILTFKRSIILNVIDLPSDRPDLLDRAIVLRVDRLDRPQPEEVLNARFGEALPRLTAAFLDLLVGAMRRVDEIQPTPGLRLSDFSRWGRAVAVHLGMSTEGFDVAYRRSMDRQSGEIIEKSPLAQAVLRFAETRVPWIGTGADLYKELTGTATKLAILGPGSHWPGAPNVMSDRLVSLAPVLKQWGVEVIKLPRTKTARSRWNVRRVTLAGIGDAAGEDADHVASPDNAFLVNGLRQGDAGDAAAEGPQTREFAIARTSQLMQELCS